MEDDATQSSSATATTGGSAAAEAGTDTTAPASTAAPPGQQQHGDDEDPDPIIASYTVYTNPTLPTSRQLLVLQQPNRKLASLSADGGQPDLSISEVRLKPRTGMVEVDIPVSHAHTDYDREKGLRWGSALQRSTAAKSGGSHGLAGGFGVGVPAGRSGNKEGGARSGRRGGLNDEDMDMDMLADWSEAVRQDKVLRTQTLGGQYPLEAESNCRWMVGVFQGDQLHLTPATSLIHLRPQLHHLDAFAEQERLSRPREAGSGPSSSGAAGSSGNSNSNSKDGAANSSAGGGGGGGGHNNPAAARAITMTIKSAGTNEIAQETMTDRLRLVQTEPWSRLRYEHDTSDRAWDMFASHLLYKGPSPSATNAAAKGIQTAGSKDKGKGKEGEGEENAKEILENEAPRLTGRWSEDEFLRAVSGRLGEGGDGEGAGADGGSGAQARKDGVGAAAAASSKAKGKATAAGPAAATASRKAGGKGKSVAFKGTAMEID